MISRRLLPLWCAGALASTACRDGTTAQGPIEDAGLESSALDGAGATYGVGPIDRDGHPLVSLLLLPGARQDEYNAQSTFDPIPRILQDALEARLVQWDTLSLAEGGPDPVDWPVPDGGTHPLLPLFLSDALLVDTSRSCLAPDGGWAATYLDIDREANALGPPHASCGGRTLTENVGDKTLNLLITAERDAGPHVTQGLAGPTKPPTAHFPYLADPN